MYMYIYVYIYVYIYIYIIRKHGFVIILYSSICRLQLVLNIIVARLNLNLNGISSADVNVICLPSSRQPGHGQLNSCMFVFI